MKKCYTKCIQSYRVLFLGQYWVQDTLLDEQASL